MYPAYIIRDSYGGGQIDSIIRLSIYLSISLSRCLSLPLSTYSTSRDTCHLIPPTQSTAPEKLSYPGATRSTAPWDPPTHWQQAVFKGWAVADGPAKVRRELFSQIL